MYLTDGCLELPSLSVRDILSDTGTSIEYSQTVMERIWIQQPTSVFL